MASVFDVAVYILEKQGDMSAMKLQKLVYYSQAWSLVWDDETIFDNPIEAWSNGPVVWELYNAHRGAFKVSANDFKHLATGYLSEANKETIDAVLEAYGNKSARWLSDQTHSEQPWQFARQGLAPLERGNNPITLASMSEYYSTI